jgi:hypothetical protein
MEREMAGCVHELMAWPVLVMMVKGKGWQRVALMWRGCRDAEGVRVGLGPPFKSSMGTTLSPACKVFAEMSARNIFLNFSKSFYGGDSNNVWDLMVVLVCKGELICENPKSV